MQPYEQPRAATESPIVGRVGVGMVVVDVAGEEVGKVSAVQMPGTEVRPGTVAGIAEALMGAGYLRIDGTGVLSNDVYASGDDITDTVEGEPGVVRLRVGSDDLPRAAG
jgi:hypothetical protein